MSIRSGPPVVDAGRSRPRPPFAIAAGWPFSSKTSKPPTTFFDIVKDETGPTAMTSSTAFVMSWLHGADVVGYGVTDPNTSKTKQVRFSVDSSITDYKGMFKYATSPQPEPLLSAKFTTKKGEWVFDVTSDDMLMFRAAKSVYIVSSGTTRVAAVVWLEGGDIRFGGKSSVEDATNWIEKSRQGILDTARVTAKEEHKVNSAADAAEMDEMARLISEKNDKRSKMIDSLPGLVEKDTKEFDPTGWVLFVLGDYQTGSVREGDGRITFTFPDYVRVQLQTYGLTIYIIGRHAWNVQANRDSEYLELAYSFKHFIAPENGPKITTPVYTEVQLKSRVGDQTQSVNYSANVTTILLYPGDGSIIRRPTGVQLSFTKF
jgi:hypothetical protein